MSSSILCIAEVEKYSIPTFHCHEVWGYFSPVIGNKALEGVGETGIYIGEGQLFYIFPLNFRKL